MTDMADELVSLDRTLIATLIERVADHVMAHAEELTALDQAIGDGDHGINMKRGLTAVKADIESISAQPLPGALKAAGMQMVMKVGGASGPLYGTLFMGLAKELSDTPTRAEAVAGFGAAIEAVKARGKARAGDKTMLDVLIPVHAAAADGADAAALRRVAAEAAEATIGMQARRGRASFLGERSLGHMDPGARSCQLLVEAVCDVLEDAA
jgi:dihydroxyacetone kinase-like protein